MDAHILREWLSYDASSGEFVWRSGLRAGLIAGSRDAQGYWILCIRRSRIKAHRAAWILVYGCEPKGVIDHINGNRIDNRISNLRDVTTAINRENQQRARSDSATGLMGVTKSSNGKRFRAVLRIRGRHTYFGTFDSAQAAHEAAVAAKRVAFPTFQG